MGIDETMPSGETLGIVRSDAKRSRFNHRENPSSMFLTLVSTFQKS
jgi:hypothetical protein